MRVFDQVFAERITVKKSSFQAVKWLHSACSLVAACIYSVRNEIWSAKFYSTTGQKCGRELGFSPSILLIQETWQTWYRNLQDECDCVMDRHTLLPQQHLEHLPSSTGESPPGPIWPLRQCVKSSSTWCHTEQASLPTTYFMLGRSSWGPEDVRCCILWFGGSVLFESLIKQRLVQQRKLCIWAPLNSVNDSRFRCQSWCFTPFLSHQMTN